MLEGNYFVDKNIKILDMEAKGTAITLLKSFLFAYTMDQI